MAPITLSELQAICPHGGRFVVDALDPINQAMEEFEIDNELRQAAFIAQLAHESGEFRYTKELATGDAYEGRKDLGNTHPGDGRRFKGRGYIQITGRLNYFDCSVALFGYADRLLSDPAILESPKEAARSAGWFWRSRKLNLLADAQKFDVITRRINGGLTGWESRIGYYMKARKVLGLEGESIES